MDNNAIKSLQTLGLTDKESRVYISLLSMKKGGVLAIAKQAGIKRPTSYHVLNSLKEKGLVSSTLFRGVKDYRALPLGSLKAYIRKQDVSVKKYMPAMKKAYDKREQKLRLRIYNNVSAIKTMLEKSLREKSIIHILGDEKLFSLYLDDYWKFYIKRSRQLGIPPKWKKKDGNINLILWSDKVAFVEFNDVVQLFGLKNKQINELYRKLWNNY